MTTPVLQTAVIDGDVLTLTYDSALDVAHQPSSSYFQVSVNTLNRSVANLSISGSTVVLTLNTGVSAVDSVTVSYTDPSAGNDVYAIQSSLGEDVASLSSHAVTNATTPPVSDVTAPSLVDASFTATSNSVITLTFDEAMQLGAGNAPTLYVNGDTPVNITNTTVSGSAILITTDATLAATDYVLVSYDGSGVLRDAAGNFVGEGTLVIGGNGPNNANGGTGDLDFSYAYLDYYPLTVRGNGGADNIIGTDSDDRFIGGLGADTINGGWGEDWINLSESTHASDMVEVMLTDATDSGSTVSQWDNVYQFDVSGTTTNDRLSLASKEIAANVSHADGIDVGSLAKHSIVSGMLTFEDAAGNAITINQSNFDNAISYLSQNLTTPGKALAFGADTDGNGYNDTTFVFQNLQGADPTEYGSNILIELVGLNGVTLGTTTTQNVIRLVDNTGPSVIDGATTSNGLSLTFYETVASVDFAGLTLEKGNGTNLSAMTPNGLSISGNVVTVSTDTAVGSTDYVLVTVSDSDHQNATDGSGNSQYLFDSSMAGVAIGGSGDTVIDLSGLTGDYLIYDPSGGNDVLTGNDGDNDIGAGIGDDSLYGGAGTDTLEGGSGNDFLDGGASYDSMLGGAGDDTYIVDSGGDLVLENSGEGTDTVYSSIDFVFIDPNLENLVLTGTTANYGTGNALSNTIIGNSAGNTLCGDAGNDNLDGGAGIDTAIYSGMRSAYSVIHTGASWTVTHLNGGIDGTDTLTGIEQLQFSNALVSLQANDTTDYNADGKADILWRNSVSNEVVLWQMDGTGAKSVGAFGTVASAWQIVDSGSDYNADGKADLLWRNSVSNEVVLWQMNGTAAKSVGAFGTVASDWQIVDSSSDYNADGKADLLWRNSVSNEVVLWQMNGTAAKSVGAFGTVSSDWQIVDSGSDYNADGKADLLWRNSVSNEVVLWQMNGTAAKSVGAFGTVASDWQIVDSSSDYNADGKADLLWRNSVSNEVVLWQMDGTGAKSVGAFGTVASDWQIVDSSSDYNADGKADLLWRNSVSNEVVLWQMNGTAAKSVGAFGTVASDWQIVDSGSDYNADGKADLLWRNDTTNEVVLWQMDGTGAKSVGSFGTVSSAWQIVDSGSDYNADGKADLLWRNDTTNEVVLWQMDGAAGKTVGAFGSVASDWMMVMDT